MKAEIVCIVDRSGSMESIVHDAIGGFNTFIEEQKKVPGEATVTLVLFDHEYLPVYQGRDINSVEPLDDKTYVPRGMTALLDSIGRTIVTVGERLDKTPVDQRPDKVIVAILTDGEENSSREYGKTKINEMINHQKSVYSWEFIFLAANQDAIKGGMDLGIDKKDSYCWVASAAGTQDAYKKMTRSVTSYRT